MMRMAPSTRQDVEAGPRSLDVELLMRIGKTTDRTLTWSPPVERDTAAGGVSFAIGALLAAMLVVGLLAEARDALRGG
jgi:hypothetical protein